MKFNDWHPASFGSCAELVRETISPDGVSVMPYIGLEHIGVGTLTLIGHGQSKDVTSLKARFQKGDILFGKLRPYFHKVVLAPFEGVCSTDIWVVRATSGVDQRFLFYWMASKEFVDTATQASEGTKMPRAKWDFVSRITRPLPSLEEQKAIAYTLGTLDDKIELNRRMNETLGAIALAIFKSWFLETEVASECGKVEDIATISRESINPDDFPEEMFDHYSVPAFDEGRLPKPEAGEQIKSNKFVVSPEAVLLCKLNPRIPRAWLPALDRNHRSICSTEFLVAVPKPEISREYLFGLFNSGPFLKDFASLVTGTSGSHQRVKPEYLLAMEATIPPRKQVEKFTEIAKPLLERIALNLAESRTLAAIRDTLLPKLLSGGIHVRNA